MLVLEIFEQHDELVAAEARGGVARADALREALCEVDEGGVARAVPEAVVDRLEVVDVEEHHAELALLAARAADRVAHALDEQRAVGQVRDGIVEGLVGELLLEGLALADVARVQHDAAHVLVVEQVAVQDLELAVAAVAVSQRALDDLAVAPRVRGAVGEHAQQPLGVLADDELIEARADELVRGVAEHPLR